MVGFWFYRGPIPGVKQTITVLGDPSAKRANVLLDGEWAGSLSDTVTSGPHAKDLNNNPQVHLKVSPGKHRIHVISARGDTLVCNVITHEHELVDVDFHRRKIMVRNRMF